MVDAGEPCIVLLDLMMPVMTGWEFLGALSTEEKLKSVPVIVLSAVGKSGAQLPGARYCNSKPVQIDPLLRQIEECRRDRAREAVTS